MSLKKSRICVLLLVIIILPSCGYRFSANKNLPFNISSIAVVILENKSTVAGIENLFTQAVVDELVLRTSLKLADPSSADAVLSGTIHSRGTPTVSRSSRHVPLEKEVVFSLAMTLRTPDGNTVWTLEDLTDRESFKTEALHELSELNRSEAMLVIAKRMAEKVVNNLLYRF